MGNRPSSRSSDTQLQLIRSPGAEGKQELHAGPAHPVDRSFSTEPPARYVSGPHPCFRLNYSHDARFWQWMDFRLDSGIAGVAAETRRFPLHETGKSREFAKIDFPFLAARHATVAYLSRAGGPFGLVC